MRPVLYSTPESAAAGRISLLSILETLIAVSAFCLVTYHRGIWLFVTSVCLAPLFLLRTDESTRRTMKWIYSQDQGMDGLMDFSQRCPSDRLPGHRLGKQLSRVIFVPGDPPILAPIRAARLFFTALGMVPVGLHFRRETL